MGRNGRGKSSLLWALQGSGPRHGRAPCRRRHATRRTLSAAGARAAWSGSCRRPPADLLYLDTVGAECEQADRDAGAPRRHLRGAARRIVAGIPDDDAPPRPLRGPAAGARARDPARRAPRGAPARRADPRPRLRRPRPARWPIVRDSRADGRAVVVATHDVEFVATVADRVVVMADGEVVADGPTAEVVVSSPAFAPQVAKILRPEPWLTVDEVARGAREHAASVTEAAAPSRATLGARSARAPAAVLALVSRRRAHGVLLAAAASRRRAGSRTARDAPFVFVGAAARAARGRARRAHRRAAWTPRPSRCSACSPRSAPPCARSAPGTAGIETVFFLLVLGGRVFGPGFGFVLGVDDAVRVRAAHRRRRPWLPFQMLGAVVGRARGRPAAARRADVPRSSMLAVVRRGVRASSYGFLLNLSFWPFVVPAIRRLSFVAGEPVLANLHRFLLYTLATSTAGGTPAARSPRSSRSW